jgi:hypothetical protein
MSNEMKTINIKGKEYVTVNERIKAFRNNYKDYALTTDIIEMSDTHCVMKACIIDPQGRLVATGYARETVSKSVINKFAFVENAETSAWGRALGNFGIGVDTAICSAEELLQKMSQEEQPKIELPLDDLRKGKIDSCRSKVELVKVCQRISKELGKDVPKYHKSLVKAYNDKLAELED